MDHNGNIEWQRSLGGSGEENGYGTNLRLTADGGYIVGTTTGSHDGDLAGCNGGSIWIVKLDSLRTIQWSNCYGGSVGNQIGFNGLQTTSDGGYIIVGSGTTSSTDVYVLKLSSTGAVQWQHTYGGSSADLADAVQQTSDGGYIVAGQTGSADGDVTFNHGGLDIWLLKLNSAGGLQWQRSYGGSQDELNVFTVAQTADNGYIVAAATGSSDGDITGSYGNGDIGVFKIDGSGNIQWQKNYGGSSGESPSSIKQVFDGGYLLAGISGSNDHDVTGHHGNTSRGDCWVVKLRSDGSIQWENSYGGSRDDGANSVQPTSGGGYIIAGASQSNNGDVSGHHGSVNSNDYWIFKLQDNNILPITLLSFTAQLQQNNTLLQWETSTEINTSYFNVQRSIDGVRFTTINKIAAAGTSSNMRSYIYTDAGVTELSANKLYYRLQEVDMDGKITSVTSGRLNFSKARSLFSVSPNPSNDFINIASPFHVAGAQVKITDMNGKTLFTTKQNFTAGQQLKVSLSHFSSGVLIVTIVSNGIYEKFKIIKV